MRDRAWELCASEIGAQMVIRWSQEIAYICIRCMKSALYVVALGRRGARVASVQGRRRAVTV